MTQWFTRRMNKIIKANLWGQTFLTHRIDVIENIHFHRTKYTMTILWKWNVLLFVHFFLNFFFFNLNLLLFNFAVIYVSSTSSYRASILTYVTLKFMFILLFTFTINKQAKQFPHSNHISLAKKKFVVFETVCHEQWRRYSCDSSNSFHIQDCLIMTK